jgi:hypothetical protein
MKRDLIFNDVLTEVENILECMRYLCDMPNLTYTHDYPDDYIGFEIEKHVGCEEFFTIITSKQMESLLDKKLSILDLCCQEIDEIKECGRL